MPYRLATSLYGRTVQVYQACTALPVYSGPPLLQERKENEGGLSHGPRGAGDGNRTRAASLEGWCSAIKLHRRIRSREGVGSAFLISPRYAACIAIVSMVTTPCPRTAGLSRLPEHKERRMSCRGYFPGGATSRNRTDDLRITKPPLCLLSYDGIQQLITSFEPTFVTQCLDTSGRGRLPISLISWSALPHRILLI